MRVNLEDSALEHLPRLAKEMGWSLREAWGQLAFVYRATQRAEVHEETPARLVTICALHFDSDEQAERFFTAMVRAQLAVVLDDGRIRIRGNERRLSELDEWRKRSVAGGKARAKAAKRDAAGQWKKLNDSPAGSQPETSREPAGEPGVLMSYSPIVLNTALHSTVVSGAIYEDVDTTAPQTRVIDNSKGRPMAPFVLAEFRRSALEHERPIPENFGDRDSWDAATIYVKYPKTWKDHVRRYHQDEFYERYGWSIKNLANNLDTIANRREERPVDVKELPF